MALHCLIMAGGQGTRFWPVSTKQRPKQYMNILGGPHSLLQGSLKRITPVSEVLHRHIVTVEAQRTLAEEQGGEFLPKENLIFEPSGRNTAPCIYLSLVSLLEKGASLDDCVAVLPSDHVILDEESFQSDLIKASELALKNNSITLIGIKPTSPHTGYGYIELGSTYSEGVNKVSSFKEKPVLEVAQKYLESGNFLWNAGMFISPIGMLLEELKSNVPEMEKLEQDFRSRIKNNESINDLYDQLPKESIDYAVIEKSKNVDVVTAQFDWNDLGSWDALESVIEKKEGNIITKTEGIQTLAATGNVIHAPGKKVSLIGVENLVVIVEGDQVVILPKNQSQKVKELNQDL